MSVKIREKKIKAGTRLYLDIYHNGIRHYEKLEIIIKNKDPDKTEKRRIAERARALREIELVSDDYEYVPIHKRRIDLIAFWQTYIDNYDKKDIRMIKYSLAKFKAFIKQNKFYTTDLNIIICTEFRDYLKDHNKSGLSGSTPYDYFKKFRKIVKQLVIEEHLKTNPAALVSLRNISKGSNSISKEVLTPSELIYLAKQHTGSQITKRTFLLACYTGMGMAEIRTLKWGQIRNNILTYNRAKIKDIVVNVELNNSVHCILGERKEDDQLVFPKIPSDNAISKNLKAWVKRAKINKNITFYCGRHTFGTLLVRSGANVRTVAELMGHKSFKHTFRYVKAVEELKKEAIMNLPEIQI